MKKKMPIAVAEESLVVTKSHEYVHISNNISFTQRKLVNALLFFAYENLLTQEVHSVPTAVLAEMVGFEKNNIHYLKEAFRSLMNVQIQWSILDKTVDYWGLATVVSQAEITGNVCKWAYAPMVREKLFNPAIYAQIDLRIQGRFRSGYALALYENCLRFRSLGKTAWIPLDVFRKLLGVDGETRMEFKILNRDVIKPAIAEINAVSNVMITAEFLREARRVTQIRFLIEEKAQNMLDLVDSEMEFDLALIARLMDFGLNEKQAKTQLALHSEEYVQSVLDYVDSKVKAGKVKDIPAYTVRALREGWMLQETKYARDKREAELKKQLQLKSRMDLANIREAFSTHRKQRIQDVLSAMDDEDRENLNNEFVASLQKVELTLFKKSGFNSGLILNLFNQYVANRFLVKPEDLDLRAFAVYNGFDWDQLESGMVADALMAQGAIRMMDVG